MESLCCASLNHSSGYESFLCLHYVCLWGSDFLAEVGLQVLVSWEVSLFQVLNDLLVHGSKTSFLGFCSLYGYSMCLSSWVGIAAKTLTGSHSLLITSWVSVCIVRVYFSSIQGIIGQIQIACNSYLHQYMCILLFPGVP